MSKTKIAWTERVWNPVTGCSRVSKGCQNCYAMHMARRFDGHGKGYDGTTRYGQHGVDWTGVVHCHPERLEKPRRWRKRSLVFVNSMSDLFHPAVPLAFIDQVFAVMRETAHTYQVLTKRPERMRAYCSRPEVEVTPNIWLGVSIEDQQTADARVPILLDTRAPMRWVSLEPQLAYVELFQYMGARMPHPLKPGLDWVVVGGESGRGARPFDVNWLAALLLDAEYRGVPVFVKQLGSRPVDEGKPLHVQHSKGGDIQEWHYTLQVRQWPAQLQAEVLA